MALDDVVVGSELDPRDLTFNQATQMFEVRLGAGMARDGSGVWSIDPAALAAAIAAAAPAGSGGLDAPTVQAMIDASRAAGTGERLASHGFDPINKTFTSTVVDATTNEQRQVVAGVPDIMTLTELAARTRPLLSVSGRAVANVLVLTP